ncbi:fasciclin [Butyricimonas faecihominis]|jgi:hypothetical protein|uniref:fasciclin n=1 Tax=Butyricimonas faecihominis TaxID=1472416 RepID=UPI00266F34A8|nr:fasciclin [Butyricimonas faecihominis]
MKVLILSLFVFMITLVSCNTDYNYIDSGLSNGVHDCTMYDYFKTNSYNWDTTRLMIDKAGLADLFKGEGGYDKIMFFGPTNHTIRKWMYDNEYKCVVDIPENVCREMILRHVVAKPLLRMEVPLGSNNATVGSGREGGIELTGLGGNKMWLYAVQEPYYGVAGAGSRSLYLESLDYQKNIPLASIDIQTTTGVVHSLHYSYNFGWL